MLLGIYPGQLTISAALDGGAVSLGISNVPMPYAEENEQGPIHPYKCWAESVYRLSLLVCATLWLLPSKWTRDPST